MEVELNDCALICPRCGDSYTCHSEIEIFNRQGDDINEGLYVRAEGLSVTTKAGIGIADDRNPSRRKNGLRVQMKCERCRHLFALELSQHKGQTFIHIGENSCKKSALSS